MMHFCRAFDDSARRNTRTGSSPDDAAKKLDGETLFHAGMVTYLLPNIKAGGDITPRLPRTVRVIRALHRCDESGGRHRANAKTCILRPVVKEEERRAETGS